MKTPEDDIITNSDESRRLPDNNPEPLEGVKQEESTLIQKDTSDKKEKSKTPVAKEQKKPLK